MKTACWLPLKKHWRALTAQGTQVFDFVSPLKNLSRKSWWGLSYPLGRQSLNWSPSMGTGGEGDDAQAHQPQKNKTPSREGGKTDRNSPSLGRKPPKGMVQGETPAQGQNLSPSSVARTAGTCTVPKQTRGTAVLSSGTGAHGPAFEASYSLIHTKKPSTSLQQKSEYISSSAEKLHWRTAAAPPWD